MPALPAVAFAIQPGFSLFGYGVARDLFRMAGEAAGIPVGQCFTAARARGPVQSSCGAVVEADAGWQQARSAQVLFVCSSPGRGTAGQDPGLAAAIRAAHRHGALLFGLGSGVWPLAAAGVLEGRTASADTGELAALRSAFPEVRFTSAPVSRDGPVATCIGGDSVTDMMLQYFETAHGPGLAEAARRAVFLKPARSEGLMRALGADAAAGAPDPRLQRCLQILDQSIDAPPSIPGLCAAAGVPERTLARLTRAAFGCSPAALAMRIRLHHAAVLLRHSPRSIQAVSADCGFAGAAHFSAAFSRRYGQTPTAFRNANL